MGMGLEVAALLAGHVIALALASARASVGTRVTRSALSTGCSA